MEIKEKDIIVVIEDKMSFGDSSGKAPSRSKESPIKGHVQMYEVVNGERKLIFEKSNLVVYLGREWVASRIFGLDNPNISPVSADEFICWFGLGSGGTVISGDPFVPDPPSSTNIDLNTSVMIHATDNVNCGDPRSTPDIGFYKHKIWRTPYPTDVTFEQDPNNANAWLIIGIQVIIGTEDANGGLLSEAGLFTSDSDTGGHTGPFHLFARVTFPSIYKDNSRQLIFVWYLYC